MFNKIHYLYSKIFKEFVTNFPDIVNSMHSTSHSFSLTDVNPYHMEGDVWTHTCLVYNNIKNLIDMDKRLILNYDNFIILCFSALFHDVGKVFSLKTSKYGRRCFYGHDNFSIKYIIDNIEKLYNIINKIIEDVGSDKICNTVDDIIIKIMLIINAHSTFYNLPSNKKGNIVKYLNNIFYLVNIFENFIYCDKNGRFSDFDYNDFDNKNENFTTIMYNDDNIVDEGAKSITIFSGLPASGKDYIAKNKYDFDVIISYDNIRVELYLDSVISKGKFDYNELYHRAFEYCNDNNVNLNNYLVDKIQKAFDDDKYDIAICNTSLTSKTRKRLINILKNKFKYCNIDCVAVLTPKEICIERDLNRKNKDKSVGEKVINEMWNIYNLPTINEGFNNIEYIFNIF